MSANGDRRRDPRPGVEGNIFKGMAWGALLCIPLWALIAWAIWCR